MKKRSQATDLLVSAFFLEMNNDRFLFFANFKSGVKFIIVEFQLGFIEKIIKIFVSLEQIDDIGWLQKLTAVLKVILVGTDN